MRWWIQPRRGKLPAALPCRSRSWLMQFDLLQDATQTQPRRLALRPYCDWIATRPRWSQLCRHVNPRLLSKLTTGSRIVTWFVSLSKGNKEVSLFSERGPALITHQCGVRFGSEHPALSEEGKSSFQCCRFIQTCTLEEWVVRELVIGMVFQLTTAKVCEEAHRRDTQNEMVSAAASWLRSLLLLVSWPVLTLRVKKIEHI